MIALADSNDHAYVHSRLGADVGFVVSLAWDLTSFWTLAGVESGAPQPDRSTQI